MQSYITLKERPDNVPEGWRIFNAPRPLLGDMHWQGDCRHGIFYAAVNPLEEYSNPFIERNRCLDAWEVKYVTMADHLAWREEFFKDDDVDWTDTRLSEWALQRYHEEHWGREI